MCAGMDEHDLDTALIGAAFRIAGETGWRTMSLAAAAREAELDLGRVRARYPNKAALLLRFGSLMDQAALSAVAAAGTPRDKVFDLLMARFDVLQAHRAGVLSLMQALRRDPGLSLLLAGATVRSMTWMLDAAEVPSSGLTGALRAQGLAAVWAYALRAWETDESSDLSATMAALDKALARAMEAEAMLPGHQHEAPSATWDAEPGAPVL